MPIKFFSGSQARVAAGLLVAEFSTATQVLVIAAIMPRIVGDLHALGAYPLAFASFFAALALFLPFAGPWADRYGARRILAIALALLALGMLGDALSPNMACFVVARFVEGIGGGLDYALSFVVIAKAFDEEQRPRMFALMSGAWVLPAIVGPGTGALIATFFGWRWAFAAFIPLIVLAALLILPALDDKPGGERLDAFSSLRLLFSLDTLRLRPGLHAGFVAFAFLHAAFTGADAYVALMLTAVRGLSLTQASVCITLAALGWCLAGFAQPSLLRRFGSSALVGGGACALCASAAMLVAVSLGAPVWIAFVAWGFAGSGIGLTYSTISLLALKESEEGTEGAISSATLLSAVLGACAGVLLCGIPIALSARGALPLATAVAYTFAISFVLSGLLFAAGLRLGPRA